MNSKKLIRFSSCYGALIYFSAFSVYYLTAFLFEVPVVFTYCGYFVKEFILALLPLLYAVSLLKLSALKGKKSAFLGAIPMAASYAVYQLPINYLRYMNMYYTTVDSLILSAVESLFWLIILYVQILVLCFVMAFCYERLTAKKGVCRKDLTKRFENVRLISTDDPLNVSILFAAAIGFAISLVNEVYDTVSYLVSASGAYRIPEIIFIVFKFIFHLATFISSAAIARYFREKISDDDNEPTK